MKQCGQLDLGVCGVKKRGAGSSGSGSTLINFFGGVSSGSTLIFFGGVSSCSTLIGTSQNLFLVRGAAVSNSDSKTTPSSTASSSCNHFLAPTPNATGGIITGISRPNACANGQQTNDLLTMKRKHNQWNQRNQHRQEKLNHCHHGNQHCQEISTTGGITTGINTVKKNSTIVTTTNLLIINNENAPQPLSHKRPTQIRVLRKKHHRPHLIGNHLKTNAPLKFALLPHPTQ